MARSWSSQDLERSNMAAHLPRQMLPLKELSHSAQMDEVDENGRKWTEVDGSGHRIRLLRPLSPFRSINVH